MPSLKCPHCQRILKVGESAAGKQITCPACKQKFRAPRPPGAAKTPPPTPSGEGKPWHVHVDGRTTGPYTADAVRDQLKAGKISRDTLAWREGMDDWKPLRDIDEFRKGARAHHPGARAGEEGEPERRRRFVPGKSKRDTIMGAWIAVGLAVVLIIVILVVANRENPNAVTDPYEYRIRRLRSAAAAGGAAPVSSTTIPAPGARTATAGKKPPKIIRKPKPQLSNEELLTKAVKEIDAQFAKCFANPGKADYKQLMVLQKKCTQYANDLKARDFGAYERDVERYVHILEGTAGGVQSQIKDISQKWYMGREGLPERAIAEQYPEDIAFLKNWQTAANEAKAKMRDRGLQF